MFYFQVILPCVLVVILALHYWAKRGERRGAQRGIDPPSKESIGHGVYIVTGAVGSGKTSWMVSGIVDWLTSGRRVYTNVQLSHGVLDLHYPGALENLVPFSDPMKLDGEYPGNGCLMDEPVPESGHKGVCDCVIVIDEATSWCPDGKMEPEVKRVLDRIRHRNIELWLIAPCREGLGPAFRRHCKLWFEAKDMGSGQHKFLGVFSAPPIRIVNVRQGAKSDGAIIIKTIRPGRLQKVLDCYDTGGSTVGMEYDGTEGDDTGDDKRRRKKAFAGFASMLLLVLPLTLWSCGRMSPSSNRLLGGSEEKISSSDQNVLAPVGSPAKTSGTELTRSKFYGYQQPNEKRRVGLSEIPAGARQIGTTERGFRVFVYDRYCVIEEGAGLCRMLERRDTEFFGEFLSCVRVTSTEPYRTRPETGLLFREVPESGPRGAAQGATDRGGGNGGVAVQDGRGESAGFVASRNRSVVLNKRNVWESVGQ